ncbi:hypothetical protein FF38_01962 [Lucilia cuprina]|uniref:snRNA-activating protein complex subunit 1 n=1 Tax=Lucilia cuprina TaxID=7375 RepID=A0A0L0CR00_LUCCU|nr:snRNA-activating protein complex subunit 1 [Lucilia cuprina]KNC34778.1 hypothetical protein FF38_01962 [Lucilia cuprina]
MEIELAIYEDCLNLIDKFVDSTNPNFKSFCEQWRNAMFQHIYAIQTTVIEVMQTTKTILHLAKRIVCAKDALGKLAFEHNDESQFLRRIGGMYLMYAVYFKQPTKQYVKILMSCETWQDFVRFIETLPKNAMTDEVRYMFFKLYKEDAFRFNTLDYDVGLENLVDYDRLYNIHNGIKSDEVVRVKLKQKLMTIAETEKSLTDMVALEEKYNKTKESLVGIDKSAKALTSTKIFQGIQDALKSVRNILEDKEIENNTSPLTKSTNYDEKRKELKRKAAGRYDFATEDEESPVEENSLQEKNKHIGRPTARNIMTQKLPEHMSDDLRNSSTDEDNSATQESFEAEQLESSSENYGLEIV